MGLRKCVGINSCSAKGDRAIMSGQRPAWRRRAGQAAAAGHGSPRAHLSDCNESSSSDHSSSIWRWWQRVGVWQPRSGSRSRGLQRCRHRQPRRTASWHPRARAYLHALHAHALQQLAKHPRIRLDRAHARKITERRRGHVRHGVRGQASRRLPGALPASGLSTSMHPHLPHLPLATVTHCFQLFPCCIPGRETPKATQTALTAQTAGRQRCRAAAMEFSGSGGGGGGGSRQPEAHRALTRCPPTCFSMLPGYDAGV